MHLLQGSRKYKKKLFPDKALAHKGFARQQWRAWIETAPPKTYGKSDGRFARQQWRAQVHPRNWLTIRTWLQTTFAGTHYPIRPYAAPSVRLGAV